MSRTIFGERIGRNGKLLVGCSAVIFDNSRNKVLLTRRADNGKWCLPSGHMEPGESAEETCIREVQEETGLVTKLTRLVGIYSNPNRLMEYPDGNKYHLIAIHFEAKRLSGDLSISNETTDFGYFSMKEIDNLDMLQIHIERIINSYTNQIEAFMK